MTNTYPNNAPYDTKLLEEVRCTRCVLERILRVMDEGLFVDYQMEKFGKDYKTEEVKKESTPNTMPIPEAMVLLAKTKIPYVPILIKKKKRRKVELSK